MGNENSSEEDPALAKRQVSGLHQHLNTIITAYSTKNIEPLNQNFHSVKKGEFQVYGQLDENEKISGYGTLRRNGSIVFEGQFVDSLRNGYGIEYEEGRVVFQGLFFNDLREGWGRCSQYEGEYSSGKRHGWGKQRLKDSCYEGYWKDNLPHGNGVKFYGRIVEKPLRFDESQLGLYFEDFAVSTDCDIYLGQWNKGQQSGAGRKRTQTYIYRGDFLQGKFHGRGIYQQNNKPPVQGDFFEGNLSTSP